MGNNIRLAWGYYLYGDNDNKKQILKEEITANSDIDEDSYFSYIADIFYFSTITQKLEANADTTRKLLYKKVLQKFGIDKDEVSDFYYSQFLAWVAKSIREAAILKIRRTKENEDNLKKYFDIICDSFYKLFLATTKNTNDADKIFENLEKKIENVKEGIESRDKNIENAKKCLEGYYRGKERCSAYYKYTERNDEIIAFSGYVDCEDEDIKHFFSCGWPIVAKKLKEITKSLNFRFIQTNKNVSLFSIMSHTKEQFCVVSIDDVIKNSLLNSETAKKCFSCCERKLFTDFIAKKGLINSGTLYVTKEPCGLCSLAIEYYRQKGVKIDIEIPKEIKR